VESHRDSQRCSFVPFGGTLFCLHVCRCIGVGQCGWVDHVAADVGKQGHNGN
jgi:hypothetical protein